MKWLIKLGPILPYKSYIAYIYCTLILLSYSSTIAMYIRDREGLGFIGQKYHKTSLAILS